MIRSLLCCILTLIAPLNVEASEAKPLKPHVKEFYQQQSDIVKMTFLELYNKVLLPETEERVRKGLRKRPNSTEIAQEKYAAIMLVYQGLIDIIVCREGFVELVDIKVCSESNNQNLNKC